MQKLREEMNLKESTFGDTRTGADWCIKALHPSDPLTEVNGIPDHCAVPTVMMNYQSTFNLAPYPGESDTWGFDATLLPHPVNFMWYKRDGGLDGFDYGNFMNSQLTGATHTEKMQGFLSLAQRWRLAYAAVTIYQDGPDLANQGTLAVYQPPVQPISFSMSHPIGNYIWCMPKVSLYETDDMPNFDTSQGMPNAYFNRSREGAYVPLKLTDTCQDWSSESDMTGIVNAGSVQQNPSVNGYIGVSEDSNMLIHPLYPHHNLVSTQWSVGPPEQLVGQVTSNMLNGTFAHICGRNLAKTTSFAFYVRMGIEMQVNTASPIAPQMKLSPQYDPRALDTYFRLAREFKDAYPSNFNDLGKLWDVISAAVRTSLPFLKPFAPMTTSILGAAVGAGDVVRVVRRKQKQKRKQKAKKNGAPQLKFEILQPGDSGARQGTYNASKGLGRDKPSQAQIERARAKRRGKGPRWSGK